MIVNWNTRALLEACLASVVAHAPEAVLWVIDNASVDGSVEALSPRYPQARWVASPVNLGFARANNLALAELTTPYAWLLNPDTEVHAGALQALETALETHPSVAVAGAGLLNADGSLQACSFPFPGPLATWVEWLYLPGPVARWRDRAFRLAPRRQSGATDWVLGAAMLVRREAMDAVGLLDTGFFMYSEEMDWCARFRRAGWETHLVPEAVVTHHGGASTRQVPEAMLVELFRSRGRFFARHLPVWRRATYGPLLILGALWNSLFLLIHPIPGVGIRTQWRIARVAFGDDLDHKS